MGKAKSSSDLKFECEVLLGLPSGSAQQALEPVDVDKRKTWAKVADLCRKHIGARSSYVNGKRKAAMWKSKDMRKQTLSTPTLMDWVEEKSMNRR